jgi:hypothetical protein
MRRGQVCADFFLSSFAFFLRGCEGDDYCAFFIFCCGGCGTARGRICVETVILSEKIQVERKLFFFDLKENPRGRFLKITEDVSGRRDTIILPSTGLEQFREVLGRAIAANAASQQQPAEAQITAAG